MLLLLLLSSLLFMLLYGFHEVQFPTNLSYRTSGGPGWSTEIIETDSGAEERVSRWVYPRHQWNAAYAIRSYEDLALLKAFYNARRGTAFGFRFKDWFDYTSTTEGIKIADYPISHLDQPIGIGDGTQVDFQLIKRYISGGITRDIKITKPVAGTVLVGLGGADQSSGWTVNTTTGIVTFSVAPTSSVAVEAGYEYDKAVRFGREIDSLLEAVYENFGSGSVPDIPLIELIDEVPISDEFFFGGSSEITLAADITITELNGRVLILDPTASGLKVKLPPTALLPLGGPYFYMRNINGTNSVIIAEEDGTTVFTLSTNSGAVVILGLDGSAVKTWYGLN